MCEETAVPVSVVRAEEVEGFVQDLTLTGTVTSPRRASLSSRTEGLVEELAVDAGSAVRKGDVLMTLDTRLARIALELVEAEIAQAEVEVAEAKRRAKEVEELARTGGFARSEAESRIAEVRIAEANLKRLQVKREEQARYWMYETIREGVYHQLFNDPGMQKELAAYEKAITEGRMTSFMAASSILNKYKSPKKSP